ncbi:MAG: ABC transporter permease [Patescibacteria group bacterium]|nr:ABC transporter permease [Patescibacteria group bacterium]
MENYNTFWKRKMLIWDLAVMDLKLRYRNSILGFIWTFLEPLLLLLVLYVVFTNIFKSQIQYFPLFLLLGLIIWNMFSRSTQFGLNSILSRSGVLSHIYVPREILPISAALTGLMMLTFEMIVFGIFLAVFGFVPPSTIVILPLIFILEFILVTGLSFPLSLLNIRFRDTQFIWGVLLQAGFFLTPVFYNIDILPDRVHRILAFSPMVQIMNMARDATLYDKLPTMGSIEISLGMTFLILIVGYAIFRKLSVKIIEEL